MTLTSKRHVYDMACYYESSRRLATIDSGLYLQFDPASRTAGDSLTLSVGPTDSRDMADAHE